MPKSNIKTNKKNAKKTAPPPALPTTSTRSSPRRGASRSTSTSATTTTTTERKSSKRKIDDTNDNGDDEKEESDFIPSSKHNNDSSDGTDDTEDEGDCKKKSTKEQPPTKKSKQLTTKAKTAATATTTTTTTTTSTSSFTKIDKDIKWNEMYDKLIEYKRVYNTCLVPKIYHEDKSLGNWVQTQRSDYKNKRPCLTQNRIDKLNKIGFVWGLIQQDAWDEMFTRLQDYKDKFGHTNVPKNYKDDVKLSHWIKTQRKYYNQLSNYNKDKDNTPPPSSSSLTKSRINKLNSIDFIWNLRQHNHELKQPVTPVGPTLQEYYDKDGDKKMPAVVAGTAATTTTSNAAATSTKTTTTTTTTTPSSSSSKQQQQHPSLTIWESMLQRLIDYKEKHGNCLVPKIYTPDVTLGNWVQTQRINYKLKDVKDEAVRKKKGLVPMTNEQISKLDNIGFVWSCLPRRPPWNVFYDQLVTYQKQNGNCLVPKTYKITNFVVEKSSSEKTTANKQEEEGKDNNEVGMVYADGSTTTTSKNDNESGTAAAAAAAATTTNGIVLHLGEWVREQRKNKDKLSQEQITKLDSIGFVWQSIQSMSWDKMFNSLVEYKTKTGHTSVTRNDTANTKLAFWINTQRTHYNRGILSKERIDRLNSIQFAFNTNASKIRRSNNVNGVVGGSGDGIVGSPTAGGTTGANKNTTSWMNVYTNQLLKYKEQHGHVKVPRGYKEHPQTEEETANVYVNLGEWVHTQRQHKKKGILSAERVKLLNDVGFVWERRLQQQQENRERAAQQAQQLKQKSGAKKAAKAAVSVTVAGTGSSTNKGKSTPMTTTKVGGGTTGVGSATNATTDKSSTQHSQASDSTIDHSLLPAIAPQATIAPQVVADNAAILPQQQNHQEQQQQAQQTAEGEGYLDDSSPVPQGGLEI